MDRRTLLGAVGALMAAGLAAACSRLTSGGGAKVATGTARVVESYGDGPLSQGEWWVPPVAGRGETSTAPPVDLSRQGRLPTVVLVHGGYWREQYDRSLEDAVATDLAARGYLVWVPDYRSSAVPWPATLTDVAAAYEHLAKGSQADLVDPTRVAAVGHSAGGHLALWLASRHRIPAGEVGAVPTTGAAPRPALAVGQAPVADLGLAFTQGLGGGAVEALLGGGPDAVPDRYAVADPVRLLPSGVRSVCIHGRDDAIVPLAQSQTYVQKASAAGDDATLQVVAGDHFVHLDPASEAIGVLHAVLSAL